MMIAMMACAFSFPYLLRFGMKLFGLDVPEDVYGFEDMDWE